MIDLHIHSTCSDGTFTPKQIVQKVIAKGLYGFSNIWCIILLYWVCLCRMDGACTGDGEGYPASGPE